jgi:prolyl-tRNA editing enzyme YbaK/EbsC (Cys-tRNA(Pro) deacylase)
MMTGNSVVAFLEERGVPHKLKPHANPALTCETAALERGVRVSQIVKCMVGATETDRLVVMLIPGDRTLKSSRARKHIAAQSLTLVAPARLADELGMTVGAISPIQLLGRARMLMDPSVLDEELVDISAGDPLLGIELSSKDLATVLDAEMVEIISRSQ